MNNYQNKNPNQNKTNTSHTIHGVFLNIFDWGVLLVGPSGIGKSELALNLIQRGRRLIADDSVEFSLNTNNELIGRCPFVLQDFLAVPCLGVINVRRLFGEQAIDSHKPLNLVVQLTTEHPASTHNLEGSLTTTTILQTTVSQIEISTPYNGNPTTLIETAVRHLQLQQTGYNAALELTERQQQLIQEQTL